MHSSRPLALITGASSGIGLEFARQLAGKHYDLILVARREDVLTELAKTLHEQHQVNVHVHACDLEVPGAVEFLTNQLGALGQTVEILINNAGFGVNGEFDSLPADRVVGMIQLNVMALTQLTHAILPAMKARRSGKILNVSSVASFQPCPYFAVYGATKAFVQSFSEALALELKGSGVTVTSLCPGATGTNFHKVAGSEHSPGLRFMDSAQTVARQGLDAMFKGRTTRVTGLMNKPIPLAARLLPRALIGRTAGMLFKKQ